MSLKREPSGMGGVRARKGGRGREGKGQEEQIWHKIQAQDSILSAVGNQSFIFIKEMSSIVS